MKIAGFVAPCYEEVGVNEGFGDRYGDVVGVQGDGEALEGLGVKVEGGGVEELHFGSELFRELGKASERGHCEEVSGSYARVKRRGVVFGRSSAGSVINYVGVRGGELGVLGMIIFNVFIGIEV